MTNELLELSDQIEALCAENKALKVLVRSRRGEYERFQLAMESLDKEGFFRGQLLAKTSQTFLSPGCIAIFQAMNESLQLIREQIDNPQDSQQTL